MKGSLVQLVSNGATEIMLTSQPHITYFKYVFKKYTSFGIDTLKLNFEGNIEFGETIICNVKKMGDLLSKLYIEIDLPKVFISKVTNNTTLTNLNQKKTTLNTNYTNFKTYTDIQLNICRTIFGLLDISTITFSNIYSSVLNYFDNEISAQLTSYNTAIQALSGEYRVTANENNLERIVKNIQITLNTDALRLEEFKTQFSNSYLKITTTYEYLHNSILDITNQINEETKNSFNFKWIEYFAYFLIERISLEIGDKEIENITGEQLYLEYLLNRSKYMNETLNKLIGNIKLMTNYDNNEKPSYKLYIPIEFNFTKNTFNSIPLVALNYHDVRIVLKLNNLKNLIKTDFTSPLESTIKIKNISLLADFIYLDNDERERFSTGSLFYLVEQSKDYKESYKNKKSLQISLPINNPCKEFYFYIKKQSEIDANNLYTYYHTRKVNNVDEYHSPIETVALQMNTQKRISVKSYKYFNYIQPYQHHNSELPLGVCLYSFSLFPDKFQPSGFCNFSYIKKSTLILELNDTFFDSLAETDKYVLQIYAKTYNFMIIENGMAHLSYAN